MADLLKSTNLNDVDIWESFGAIEQVDDLWNPKATGNLDGGDDKYLLKAGSVLTNQTHATIMGWFKIPSMPVTPHGTIIAQGDTDFDNSQFILFMNRDQSGRKGQLSFFAIDGASTAHSHFRTNNAYDTDEWTHYAIAIEPSAEAGPSLELYINGVLDNSFAAEYDGFEQFGFDTAAKDLTIGTYEDGSNNLKGISTRPHIVDVKLAGPAISDIYNAELAARGEGFPQFRRNLLLNLY